MRIPRAVVLASLATAAMTSSTGAATAADGTGGLPAPTTDVRASAPAPVASPAAPRIKVTQTVELTRSQTRSVQRRVHVRADGRIGLQTRRAIRRYQKRRKIMRTGRPNLQTLRAMRLGFAEKIAARMTQRASADAVAAASGRFPIQGAWRRGGSATTFGSRGGDHQGVDLFAACGTPLVAASPGTVKTRKYQSRAGNYVVLTGTPSGEDEVYMHMEAPSPLKVGDAVAAGTPLGTVGATGRAEGCHLHFELWTAPGWYEGGRPHDPTARLNAWAAAAGNPASAR